ncbi:uncharacterized protein LOC112527849 [Cynara cardunculus var. scolymus]|uniref:Tetratricopeptide-like helical n=1 Tax=Cynara cardunculus var. scolymus TaxID=59895 RepID=A0A103XQY1_CYNCS|nr:uncharacterized protein LOC112527849 [Cynara cardunculus var. scolymus]KVH95254.1 Tetratricopeptide-like helical [Cynara cardunculus var. scolymus]
MKAVLIRTGSVPIHSSLLSGSPRLSIHVRHNSFSGSDHKVEFSPLLHLEVNNNRRRISRTMSEPQGITRLRSISAGSQTFQEMLPEVDEESLSYEDVVGGTASLKFAEKCFDLMSSTPASGIKVDELQFPSAGSGSGKDRDGFGPGRSSGGSSNNDYERSKIGAYYQQMLKSNPNDPLILRNYGKFLHEVEGDPVKAEEYYGRAILASPGDGELLSLYGKLIWDTHRDGERAKSYFDQAASASPDDCMVMGSYAQFMWEADEDEDESGSNVSISAAETMVAAF